MKAFEIYALEMESFTCEPPINPPHQLTLHRNHNGLLKSSQIQAFTILYLVTMRPSIQTEKSFQWNLYSEIKKKSPSSHTWEEGRSKKETKRFP